MGKLRGPIVRRMRLLVERYREECDIDRLILHLTLAEAYAKCLAHDPNGACP